MVLNLIRRLFSMITVINLTLLIIYKIFKIQILKDVISSMSMIIFLMVFPFWLTGDIFQAYDEMLDSFNIELQNTYLKYVLCFIVDFCIHVIPFILMGFPQNNTSIIIALFIIDIWYFVIHQNVSEIYTPFVNSKLHYSVVFVHICMLFLFIVNSLLFV